MSVDGLILTGGEGRRLGGADKASIRIGPATLLDHALDAVRDCREVVVVGAPSAAHGERRWVREEPAGGGPVAGIAAGLRALPPDGAMVLVLACDMPRAARAVPALLHSAQNDGAWVVDGEGRVQPLLALYRRAALVDAVDALGDPHGASMRALTAMLEMVPVHAPEAARDADTWDDVRTLRKEWE